MQLSKLARWTLATALGGSVILGDVAVPTVQGGAGTIASAPITFGTPAQARSSGGRSGGGSISRPSSNKSRSSSNSSSSAKGTSFEDTSVRSRSSSASTAHRQPNRDSQLTVVLADQDGASSSGDTANDWLSVLLIGGVFVTVSGFKLVTAIAEAVTALKDIDFDGLQRLNELVTVTTLQVAMHVNEAHDIQTELATLSQAANTDQPEGLLELLQNSALAVLRAADRWCYGNGTAKMLYTRDQATACFNAASLEERSKFSDETWVNVDGQQKQEPSFLSDPENGQYVVVTFIVASEADTPLFRSIESKTDLQAALTRLAAMPVKDLLRVEVFWTPQVAPEGLTQEDLLVDYTNLILL